jgi:hypothetical protein
VQVTVLQSACESVAFRACCGTFLLYSLGRPRESRLLRYLPPCRLEIPQSGTRDERTRRKGSAGNAF